MTWFIAIAIFGVGAFVTWWLVFESEGVYLGRRVVIKLYDLYAGRYDNIKSFVPEYDHLFLAKPIMGAVAPQTAPVVLDVATGTGRLIDALLNHTHFEGYIIGADLSRRMLGKAAEKFIHDGESMALVWTDAHDLPFDDDSFDVVTCLEALEFMADAGMVLDELIRVLRPGGLLMLTNRINTRWMPGKTFSAETLTDLLKARGIEDVTIDLWQRDYNLVRAIKSGQSAPVKFADADTLLNRPFEIAHDGVLEVLTNAPAFATMRPQTRTTLEDDKT